MTRGFADHWQFYFRLWVLLTDEIFELLFPGVAARRLLCKRVRAFHEPLSAATNILDCFFLMDRLSDWWSMLALFLQGECFMFLFGLAARGRGDFLLINERLTFML